MRLSTLTLKKENVENMINDLKIGTYCKEGVPNYSNYTDNKITTKYTIL